MSRALNGHRGKRWWPALLAGFTAVVVTALGGVMNVATSLLPTKWAWIHDPWIIWGLAGALLVLAVVLAMTQAQDDRGCADDSGGDRSPVNVTASAGAVIVTGSGPVFIGQDAAAGPVPPDSSGHPPGGIRRVLTGEIPARPVAFLERPAVVDLARAWDPGARVCVVQVLTGGPGVGKTQVAAAYARDRAAAGWPLVAWVPAETQDQLLAGLADVAVAAGVADADGDSAVSARKVRSYLETFPGPALVVFDNATEVEELSAFLPTVGAVQLVITSRERAFTQLGMTVDIGLFTPAQSVAYLNKRTGLAEIDGAAAVAVDLGHLPLALAQAATVMSEYGWNYAAFRHRLRGATAAKYLARHPGDPYPRGAAEAIALATQSIGEQDNSGLTDMIMRLLAVLSSEGVDRSVLAGLAAVPMTAMADLFPPAWDDALDKALGRLVSGSIITRSATGQVFSMHGMVRRVMLEREEANGRWLSTLRLAAVLLAVLRIPDEEQWLRREAGSHLVRQINAVWAAFSGLASIEDAAHRELTELLISLRNWSIQQLEASADLSRATSLGTVVLADCELVLGLDHPSTLISRNLLASVYRSAEGPGKAVPLDERNLAARERLLGRDHPDTLISCENLALDYQAAGRLREAITLSERNLAEREQLLGPGHHSTTYSYNNLALAYRSVGRLREAITLHERDLVESERLLGLDHPDTLIARCHLADAYRSTGRLCKAITLSWQNASYAKHTLNTINPRRISYQHINRFYILQAGTFVILITVGTRLACTGDAHIGGFLLLWPALLNWSGLISCPARRFLAARDWKLFGFPGSLRPMRSRKR